MMRTKFETPKEYADKFIKAAVETDCVSGPRPEHFKEVMEKNIGAASEFSPIPPLGDGLERKNPLIVALGDSITAGHFEMTLPFEEIDRRIAAGTFKIEDCKEVTDVLASYPEQFRRMLIDKYELTSVSVINSGIAGDTVLGMERRLDRDVICHRPHLVIINAVMNWYDNCGDLSEYERSLRAVVYRVKHETEADIILMTPNMALPMPLASKSVTLEERVGVVRKIAKEQDVCLVDVYKIWEAYHKDGNPLEPLLANASVHPSVTGHEGYAIELMKAMQ